MKRKLLIVDDQDEVRRYLQRAAESLGYEVRTAPNGKSGIDSCNEWNPDAVLTDIFMPERDGLETIREIRRSRPGIRILAMSGGGNMGHVDILRTARAMGAERVLAKPFNKAALAGALGQLLDAPSDAPPRARPDSGPEPGGTPSAR